MWCCFFGGVDDKEVIEWEGDSRRCFASVWVAIKKDTLPALSGTMRTFLHARNLLYSVFVQCVFLEVVLATTVRAYSARGSLTTFDVHPNMGDHFPMSARY